MWKVKLLRHLKDNIENNFADFEVGEDLFNNTNHKGKIDTLDFNKINYFCLPKDKTHKRTHLRHQLQTKGWYPEHMECLWVTTLSDGQTTEKTLREYPNGQ